MIKDSDLFCRLCWRPAAQTTRSIKHCSVHRQPYGSKLYKKRLRRLKREANRYTEPVKVSDVFELFERGCKSPNSINKSLFQKGEKPSWEVQAEAIEEACEEFYAFSFEKIKQIDARRFDNFGDWGSAVINACDDLEPMNSSNDWVEVLRMTSKIEERRIFLKLLARIHVEFKHSLNSEVKRGPARASRNLNLTLLRALITAYDEREELGITVNLSRIAKEHSVCRQTIHEKWKKLEKEPELYRKAASTNGSCV